MEIHNILISILYREKNDVMYSVVKKLFIELSKEHIFFCIGCDNKRNFILNISYYEMW